MGLPDILAPLEYRRLQHCRTIQGDPGGEWWRKIFPVGRIWALCLIVHYYWSGRWTEALILLVHKPLLMIWLARNRIRLLVTGNLGEEICGWNFQNGNGVWKYFCHLWALTKEASTGEKTLKNQEDKIMPSGGVSQPLSAVIQCLLSVSMDTVATVAEVEVIHGLSPHQDWSGYCWVPYLPPLWNHSPGRLAWHLVTGRIHWSSFTMGRATVFITGIDTYSGYRFPTTPCMMFFLAPRSVDAQKLDPPPRHSTQHCVDSRNLFHTERNASLELYCFSLNLTEDLNKISKIIKTCEGPGEKLSRQRDEQVQGMRLTCSNTN